MKHRKVPHPPGAGPLPRRTRFPFATLACCPPALRPVARQVHRQRPPCLLCGGGYHALGVFVPWRPEVWGIAEGWQGGCAYGLCAHCVALPDRDAQVEQALWQGRLQAVARWN
jgi:hypothetical protein